MYDWYGLLPMQKWYHSINGCHSTNANTTQFYLPLSLNFDIKVLDLYKQKVGEYSLVYTKENNFTPFAVKTSF